MSRIGRMPIAIPAGVTVEVAENNKVTVKGPKGTLERVLPGEMEIKVKEGRLPLQDRMIRTEERRVRKECRSRWAAEQ